MARRLSWAQRNVLVMLAARPGRRLHDDGAWPWIVEKDGRRVRRVNTLTAESLYRSECLSKDHSSQPLLLVYRLTKRGRQAAAGGSELSD